MKKKVLTIGVIFIILVAVVVTAVLLTLPTNYQLMKNDYVVNSKVGQSMEVLGTVPRKIPEQTSNGGLSRYPVYATTLTNMTTEEKQALLDEDASLRASSSTYDSMDSEGNLYLNGQATGEKLYKHTASVGMYYDDVDDDEVAVIKRISVSPRPLGNYITGLYAPAGEVIKMSPTLTEQ